MDGRNGEYCEMKMVVAQAQSNKVTLLLAAIVLVVSGFVAAVPFILSQNANAMVSSTVTTKDELKTALADSTVDYIELGNNITTDEKLVLDRSNVIISGQDKSINFTGDTAGWQGNYVFQIYNASNIEINSLRVSGGDAGILINSSEVLLKGNTHVDNFEFGGIEVSKSSNPGQPNSSLVLQGALWNETFTEANAKPAVWLVNGEGTINSSALYQTLIPATHIKAGQTQYYLRAVNADATVTNTTQSKTYTTLEAAIAGANGGDKIELNKDITLSQMVFVDKAITIDGKAKTVTAPYSYTTNGVDNAVLTITSDNVTIKNFTTDNTSAAAKPHGIVVQDAHGVVLENVTLKNGRAGAIINGSGVQATNINTVNNAWGGINVDKNNAELKIGGLNTHADAAGVPAIWTDNRTVAAVVDVDNRYDFSAVGAGDWYSLDSTPPAVPELQSPANNAVQQSNDFYFNWNDPTDSVRYEIQASQSSEVDANGSLKNGVWHGDYQQVEPTDSQAHSIGASGTWYWQVRSVDTAGNKSAWTAPWVLTIDNVAPAAPVITNSPVYVNASEAWDLARWTHDGADVDHFEYREYNSQAAADADNAYWTQNRTAAEREQIVGHSWTGNVTLYYRIVAVDAAGNRSPVSELGTVYIDKSSPVVGITGSTSDSATPTISGTADPDANFAYLRIDGGNEIQIPVSNGLWSHAITSPLGNGQYGLSVLAEDAAGNRSIEPATAIMTVAPAPLVDEEEPTEEPANPNPGAGTGTGSETPAAPATPAAVVATIVPTFLNPATNFATVLGESTDTPATQPDDNDEAVEGASTLNNLAQAADVDSEANQGLWLGLDWYWWLLIIAAVAGIIWWISAAIRNRQTQS